MTTIEKYNLAFRAFNFTMRHVESPDSCVPPATQALYLQAYPTHTTDDYKEYINARLILVQKLCYSCAYKEWAKKRGCRDVKMPMTWDGFRFWHGNGSSITSLRRRYQDHLEEAWQANITARSTDNIFRHHKKYALWETYDALGLEGTSATILSDTPDDLDVCIMVRDDVNNWAVVQVKKDKGVYLCCVVTSNLKPKLVSHHERNL